MKKLHTLVLACIGLISISSYTTAYAGNKPGDVSVTVGGGYEFFAPKRRLQNVGIPIMFALGYDFTTRWGVEAMIQSFNTRFNRSTDEFRQVNGRLFTFDGIYRFIPCRVLPCHILEPYVFAGVGVTSLNPNRFSANDEGNINAGVGAQFFVNEIVAFRAEVRDLYTWVGGKNDVVLNAGVTFAFNCF